MVKVSIFEASSFAITNESTNYGKVNLGDSVVLVVILVTLVYKVEVEILIFLEIGISVKKLT